VTASLLIKHVLSEAAVSFLLVAVVVIAISAAAGWWLRQVAREAA
jgi:hypothetical protein